MLDVENSKNITYYKKWNLFNQIIYFKTFSKIKIRINFKNAEVFNEDLLKIYKGKLKKSSFRTYIHK
jgi:hypothetical protein